MKIGIVGKRAQDWLCTLSCRQEPGGIERKDQVAGAEQRRFFPQHKVRLWKGYCDPRNNWTASWRRNPSRRVKCRDGTFVSGGPWGPKNCSLGMSLYKHPVFLYFLFSVSSCTAALRCYVPSGESDWRKADYGLVKKPDPHRAEKWR